MKSLIKIQNSNSIMLNMKLIISANMKFQVKTAKRSLQELSKITAQNSHMNTQLNTTILSSKNASY